MPSPLGYAPVATRHEGIGVFIIMYLYNHQKKTSFFLDSSKIYEHAFDSNHPISDDSFKILSNSTVFDLKVLESLYIHKFQPNLNDYNSSFDLHIVKLMF